MLEFVKDYEGNDDSLLAGLHNNDVLLDYAMITQVSDISIYHKIFQEDIIVRMVSNCVHMLQQTKKLRN